MTSEFQSQLVEQRVNYLLNLYNNKHLFPAASECPPRLLEVESPFDNPELLDQVLEQPPNELGDISTEEDSTDSKTNLSPFKLQIITSIFEFLSSLNPIPNRDRFSFICHSHHQKGFELTSDSVSYINDEATDWLGQDDYFLFRWNYGRLIELVSLLIDREEEEEEKHYTSWIKWLNEVKQIDHPYKPYKGVEHTLLELVCFFQLSPRGMMLIDQSKPNIEIQPSTVLLNPAYEATRHLLSGEVKTAVCQVDSCHKAYIKTGPAKYCSDECRQQIKLESNLEFRPVMVELLVAELDQKAKEGHETTADEIYTTLNFERKDLFPNYTGGSRIATWLVHHQSDLQEKYGLVFKSRLDSTEKIKRYTFSRIQS